VESKRKISKVIKELSINKIWNVLSSEGDFVYTFMKDDDVRLFAQYLIDINEIDEVFFIIELKSE
jgi:hypothetical protein